MLDTRNRAQPYRNLAEECRRLATSSASRQVKNRYLLMAQDYMRLADLREEALAKRIPATAEEDAALAAAMTSRFCAPWRIVEIPHGFAVDDAAGQQVAVFYGLADPNAARETDFLTIDEARQMAVDFAKLPEVAGLRLAEMRAAVPKSTSLEPDEWMPTPSVSRPSDPLPKRISNRTKSLIAIAVAALPAGYFIFGYFDRPVDVAHVPQAATDRPPVQSSSVREADPPSTKAAGITVEGRAEPEVQTAPLPAPPDTKLPASSDAKSPPPSDAKLPAPSNAKPPAVSSNTRPSEGHIQVGPPQPERGRQSFAASRDDSTCLPSASAVRENHPGAWPSWTLRAPGHENTRCWYPATRTTAHEH